MTFRVRLAQPRRAIQLCSIMAFLLISGLGSNGYALDAREYAVEASVEVLNVPFGLRITWRSSPLARNYTIRRRDYLSADWGSPRATLPAGSSEYLDTQVLEGRAYEYEIRMEATTPAPNGWVNAYGYVLAGAKVSWPDQKGKVLLLIDQIAAGSLNVEIQRFEKDLIGAGWTPIRRNVDRTSSVNDVKSLVRAEYNADRANLRSVILLGNLPVPYSGNIAPDLHATHKGAWPADVFYAEMDGSWTDSTVNITSGDSRANDNRPGDGKFDQSQIPSHVELEIGRIDVANLPSFVSFSQIDLLRRYLQKNHDFRHRAFTSVRRGLIRDNFGDLDGDAPAVDGWRHYPQFFGQGQLRVVGPGSFFPTLNSESFLWAYGCGGGGNNKADGVGTTTDFATQSPRAVFLVLHGSYFGDWNVTDNFLRAGIASSGHTLASIWSGLPHWYMHPMALGANLGSCTRITQNNINQYQSHVNLSAQQVHISLIGDPTLEMFPVIPPRNLSGSASAIVNLTWAASTDENIVGYQVYHSPNANGPFSRLTTSPVSNTSYSHATGIGTHHYMVRAVKLDRTGSGTFYNLSQGIFTSVTKTSGGVTPTVTINLEDSNVSEAGPNTGTIRVSRNVADANALSVELIRGGTAQNGIDYASIASSIVIPAWANDARISVVPMVDNVIEGTETLTVQIKPSVAYTVGEPPSVSVEIGDVNKAPTISQIPDQVVEAGTSTAIIPFGINDPESAPSTLQLRAQSSNESLVPQSGITLGGNASNRNIQITAANAGAGEAAVTLFVSDGVNEVSESFKVTVTPPNLPPTADAQAVVTLENSSIEILLTGQDPEAGFLSYSIKSGPTNGTLSGSAPNVIYTPSTNFFGSDAFTFVVMDGRHESSPARVLITVTELNRRPTATGATLQAAEDVSIIVQLQASDPNGDALTYEIVVQPTKGELIGTNGLYQYVPFTNAHGGDSFGFRVRDSELVSDPAVVNIEIEPRNDSPEAVSLQLWLEEDETLPLTLRGTDVDQDTLTFQVVTMPMNGVITGTPPELFYKPRADFSGRDSLQFVARDGAATSRVATISFEITPLNDVPTAVSQELRIDEDTIGLLTLDGTDADGDALRIQLVSIPTNGVISGTPPELSYRPHVNFHGQDLLTYFVTDGTSTSAIASVSIMVNPVNDVPAATNQEFVLEEDEDRSFILRGMDVDGDPLSWVIVRFPTNGTLRGTAPEFSYLPDFDFNGNDSLLYVVSDGKATSAVTTVSFAVSPLNDPPNALNQTLVTDEDVPIEIELIASDPERDPITLFIVDPPQHGTLSGALPNLVFTPTPDFNGEDVFTFKARDGALESSPAKVTIAVGPKNDPPVIGEVTAQAIHKNYWAGPVTFRVDDPDRSISSLTLSAESSNPELIDTNGIRFAGTGTNRTLTLVPFHGVIGTSLITVTVSDGQASAQTTFPLTVTNIPPVARLDYVNGISGRIVVPTEELLANDHDLNQDDLRIIAVTESTRGNSVVLTNDAIIYSGNGAGGVDSFHYTVEDTSQETATGRVWVILTANPQIRSITFLGNDVLLKITGDPQRPFRLLSSVDAVNWEDIGGGTSSTTGTADFKHVDGGIPPFRFYKVEWQ